MAFIEGQFGHGGRKPSSLRRWVKRQTLPKAMASVPFDWNKGVDNSDKISKIKNQYQSSSCYGQSTAYLLEILTGKEISAKSIYAPIHAPGGGVFILDGEKEINDCGANLEVTVPSYKPDGTTDEPFMSDTSFLTPQNIEEAMERAGYKTVSIAHDMDSIAQAIEEYGHVQIMLPIQNGNTPNWLSSTPQPPVSSNPNPLDYHYMTLVGAGQPLGYQRLKASNSWGEAVGISGYQFFDSRYLPFFMNVISYYKPQVIIPPIVMGDPLPQPIEVPLQSTSTLAISHPSSFWVSFWTLILKLFTGK